MSKTLEVFSPDRSVTMHKNIRFHPELTSGEKIFMSEIHSMSEKGRINFSSRHLSKVFNVSHQTIINWIKKLSDLDLIEVTPDAENKYGQYITAKKLKDA